MSAPIPVWAANRSRTRPPVVALAGGFEPIQTWQAVARACPAHPLYVLGNPRWNAAHEDGGSRGNPLQPSLREYIFSLDHTLASLGIQQAILVATGMLGEIALAYAAVKAQARTHSHGAGNEPFNLNVANSHARLYTARNPIGALILADVTGAEPTLRQRSGWFEDAITLLSEDTAGAVGVMERYLREGLSAETLENPGCGPLLRRWADIGDRGSAASLLRIQSARGSWVEAASEITVPATLLASAHLDDDRLRATQDLAQQLCTTLATVPASGTVLQVDRPHLLAEKITRISPFVVAQRHSGSAKS